ncbi:MAG: isovaleryl-CoA dehydrogenase [Bradymonadia bacterium]
MSSPLHPFSTHEVQNQPPALGDYNLFTNDPGLVEAVKLNGAEWALEDLTALGARAGTAEMFHQGHLAHLYPPVLHTFDAQGRRRDQVEFHPAWHTFMGLSVSEGVHTGPWADPKPGAHVARAAKAMMLSQVEPGHQCPITMTYGVVPVLQNHPEVAEAWMPKLLSTDYDPRFMPAEGKAGVIMGMGMTEKQGGSDVRANSTRATPNADGSYTIVGHKWFFSAPQCDAWLILAQAPKGISCFLLPRFTPDGQPNALRFQRLKNKLGNRSNASSEVEFHNALAWPVGPEGKGVRTIIEMATYTRLDCCLGSAGATRQAVTRAVHHARHRHAFGKALIDQPLMANVLADLAVEAEAAQMLALHLAAAFDARTREGDDGLAGALCRVMTPAAKYWICKRGPMVAAEAMEVFGGNGYVEDGPMAALYREMPLNSIWEGSGNVMCLDVLRAIQRTPDALGLIFAELEKARGGDARLDMALDGLKGHFADPASLEFRARHVAEQLVLAYQGALLTRLGPTAVAEAFCGARLGGQRGGAFGNLPAGTDTGAILQRALVETR